MANTGYKGIDVKQTGDRLIFDVFLQDGTGTLVTGDSPTLKLYELQSDKTLKSYDFSDDTFKSTALTTETLAMVNRLGNNNTTETGYYNCSLTTLTGFTVGAIYLALVSTSLASPTEQLRKFQFGSAEGDLVTVALATGLAYLKGALDAVMTEPSAPPTFSDTYLKGLAYIAALCLNEIEETASNQKLRNNADSGDISNAPMSDDGTTFERGKPA